MSVWVGVKDDMALEQGSKGNKRFREGSRIE